VVLSLVETGLDWMVVMNESKIDWIVAAAAAVVVVVVEGRRVA
jgi:hypothetical protein